MDIAQIGVAPLPGGPAATLDEVIRLLVPAASKRTDYRGRPLAVGQLDGIWFSLDPGPARDADLQPLEGTELRFLVTERLQPEEVDALALRLLAKLEAIGGYRFVFVDCADVPRIPAR